MTKSKFTRPYSVALQDRMRGAHYVACTAQGCPNQTVKGHLFCREHWEVLPSALRGQVYREARRCADGEPSELYIVAASLAVLELAYADQLLMTNEFHQKQYELRNKYHELRQKQQARQ